MSLARIDDAAPVADGAKVPARKRSTVPRRRSVRTLEKATVRSPVALALPEGMSFDEWHDVGQPILEAGQSIMWWVGDWLAYGEDRYGTMHRDAATFTGIDFGTMANAKWVAKAIEPSRRREGVSFGHHQAVAPLAPADQDRLLELARVREWSVQELRNEIRSTRAAAAGSGGCDDVTGSVIVRVPADAERVLDEVLELTQVGLRRVFAERGVAAEVGLKVAR